MKHRSTSRFGVVQLMVMATATVAMVSPMPAAAAPVAIAPGGVRLVHGLRGVVADVYLDGVVVLQSFEVERSTDLINLPPGDHSVEVRLSGDSPSNPPILSGVVTLQSGQDWSVALHLSSDGVPMVSQFLEDNAAVAAGQTRIVVRHTAAAPPIDVTLSDAPIAAGLVNPGEAGSQVAAGTYQVAVKQAGTAEAIAPVQDVPFQEGTVNDMYLIGDQASGTLGWIGVQTSGLQSSPAIVQTGDSGLAHPARTDSSSSTLAVMGGGAVVLLATAGWRRRRLSRWQSGSAA
jgi:hypothetical protein